MVFSLRSKILLGYGIALLLVIVVLAWAVTNLLTLGKASDAILRENYVSIRASGDMLAAAERQNDALFLLLQGNENESLAQFHSNEVEFLQSLGRARDNITVPGEERIVQDIDSTYTVFLDTVSRLRIVNHENPIRAVIYYRETASPALDSVLTACLHLRDINQETMYRASSTARNIATRAVTSTLFVGFATFFTGLFFSLLLSNRITRPLENFMAATRKISAGDYAVRVPVTSSDEIGHLAGEFNAMTEKLKVFNDLNIGRIVAEKGKSEAIIRNIDDGLIVTDASNRILNINPAASRILNTTPADAEGKHFLEIVRNDALFRYVESAGKTGMPVTLEEGRNVFTLDREGTRHYYQFSITPVSAGPDTGTGVLLLLRDVTRLTELDQLKSQFVMTASHELRTPLTSALMSVDLLMERTGDRLAGEERQLLETARSEMYRLRALVNDLLELSKIESGKIEMTFENVSIRDVVDQTIAVLKPQAAERKLELSAHIPENLPPVKADPSKIGWVLTNLISNAFRYTDPDGFVRISAELFGSQVHVTVRDNGTGIPYEDQSRIFDKFVQVKSDRESGGSGLGLAISKEIVRAHGGTIWVDSTPGEGSAFTFTLPVFLDVKKGIPT